MSKDSNQSERQGCSFFVAFITTTIPALLIIAVLEMGTAIGGHYNPPFLGAIIIALSTTLVIVVPCILSPNAEFSKCRKQALTCLIFSLMTSLPALSMWQFTTIQELTLLFGKAVITFFLARWLSFKLFGIAPTIRIALGLILLIATLITSIILLSNIWIDDF